MKVNIHEAKTNLSQLLKKVNEGQEIIIARAGTPVARLVAYTPKPDQRVAGTAKGRMTMADDFNDPLPEYILGDFEK